MYRLPPEHARIGTPLRTLLAHRLSAGTFAGDPDRYVADCMQQVAEGRTETKTIELKDGRIIAVVSRPMQGGGWVATHSDVTERLLAEKERDSLRLRDERRRNTDSAISSFRARVETVLKTVGQSATAMKTAATTLLATSDRTLQRAEGAVHGSNEASVNVETAASGGGRTVGLDQGDRPPARPRQRGGARRRRRRRRHQSGYRGARACGAEDRRRGQADPGHCRADQSLGAQRHHRGGARRRGRARLCGGRLGSEIARRANREGDRGDHQGDRLGADIERQGGVGDPRDHAADEGHHRAIPARSRSRSSSRNWRPEKSRTMSPAPRAAPRRSSRRSAKSPAA